MSDWYYWRREHRGTLMAIFAFLVMFAIYTFNNPAGLNSNIAQTAANKGVLLALVAIAQTVVVVTSGIDLSVGMTMVLANCLASRIVLGDPWTTGLGVAGVLLMGCCCGAVNGLIVVYGRLQPIVTTIATGSIFFGLALALRSDPGGDVNSDLAEAMTGKLWLGVPASLAVLAAVVLLIWMPYRRSVIGRSAYAIGSSENAAFMSGLAIKRAKFTRCSPSLRWSSAASHCLGGREAPSGPSLVRSCSERLETCCLSSIWSRFGSPCFRA
jgi:ribose transport system permease protein